MLPDPNNKLQPRRKQHTYHVLYIYTIKSRDLLILSVMAWIHSASVRLWTSPGHCETWGLILSEILSVMAWIHRVFLLLWTSPWWDLGYCQRWPGSTGYLYHSETTQSVVRQEVWTGTPGGWNEPYISLIPIKPGPWENPWLDRIPFQLEPTLRFLQ